MSTEDLNFPFNSITNVIVTNRTNSYSGRIFNGMFSRPKVVHKFPANEKTMFL